MPFVKWGAEDYLCSHIAAVGKLFGIKGLFYRICGPKARAIDGPCDYTIPLTMTTRLWDRKTQTGSQADQEGSGLCRRIIDANDLGVNILGVSGPEVEIPLLEKLLKDNPLGQSAEQTPIGIIRLAKEAVLAGQA